MTEPKGSLETCGVKKERVSKKESQKKKKKKEGKRERRIQREYFPN